MRFAKPLLLIAAVALAFAGDSLAQDPADAGFDPALAAELGADQHGMRRYVVVFLRSGASQGIDADAMRELQHDHIANINRLADEGHLVLAGPFLDRGQLRGLFMLDVASVDEARELVGTDPMIQAGVLVAEFHTWYGSAAIKQVTGIHRRISKESP